MNPKDRSDIYQWISRNRVSEAELRDTALRIRDAYVNRRRVFYPGYQMEASLETATDRWMRLMMMLWEHEVNHEDYITAQFDAYPNSIPPPGAIIGEAGIKVYLKWKAEATKAGPLEAENALRLSASGLRVRREQYGSSRSDRDHLMGQDNPCDALFSWCHLMTLGLMEEADKFAPLARHLLRRPFYKETYMKLFRHILESYSP